MYEQISINKNINSFIKNELLKSGMDFKTTSVWFGIDWSIRINNNIYEFFSQTSDLDEKNPYWYTMDCEPNCYNGYVINDSDSLLDNETQIKLSIEMSKLEPSPYMISEIFNLNKYDCKFFKEFDEIQNVYVKINDIYVNFEGNYYLIP